MIPKHVLPVADVASAPKWSFFMILATSIYINLAGLAIVVILDNHLRLGLLAQWLKWIKENAFF